MGFEPTVPCGTYAFQAHSFDHSDISPVINYIYKLPALPSRAFAGDQIPNKPLYFKKTAHLIALLLYMQTERGGFAFQARTSCPAFSGRSALWRLSSCQPYPLGRSQEIKSPYKPLYFKKTAYLIALLLYMQTERGGFEPPEL